MGGPRLLVTWCSITSGSSQRGYRGDEAPAAPWGQRCPSPRSPRWVPAWGWATGRGTGAPRPADRGRAGAGTRPPAAGHSLPSSACGSAPAACQEQCPWPGSCSGSGGRAGSRGQAADEAPMPGAVATEGCSLACGHKRAARGCVPGASTSAEARGCVWAARGWPAARARAAVVVVVVVVLHPGSCCWVLPARAARAAAGPGAAPGAPGVVPRGRADAL